jgi:hypothetical protein
MKFSIALILATFTASIAAQTAPAAPAAGVPAAAPKRKLPW